MASTYGITIQEWYERRIDRALALADTGWLAITAYALFSAGIGNLPGWAAACLLDPPILSLQVLAVGIWRSQRTAFALAFGLSIVGILGCFIAASISALAACWLFGSVLANGGWSLYRLQHVD